MQRVVAIHGSPRRGGNIDAMMQSFIEPFESSTACQVEHVYAYDLSIKPCNACFVCETDKRCVIRDDMDTVIPMLESAALIVVGVPVYFCGVPASCKTLIDRIQPLYVRKYIKQEEFPLKKGVLISCCEQDINQPFIGIEKTIQAFFYCLNATCVETFETVLAGSLVNENEDLKESLKTAGKNIVSSMESNR